MFLNHPPDARSYAVASHILQDLGIQNIKLLTNNPDKSKQLQNEGILVMEEIPLVLQHLPPSSDRDFYLKTKKEKMGHRLNVSLSMTGIASFLD